MLYFINLFHVFLLQTKAADAGKKKWGIGVIENAVYMVGVLFLALLPLQSFLIFFVFVTRLL